MGMPAARRAVVGSVARAAARDELAFECHGTRIRVRSDDASVLAAVAHRLPPGATPCAAACPHVWYRVRRTAQRDDAAFHLAVGGEPPTGAGEVAYVRDADAAAALLLDDVEFRVALHAPDRLFVHAAAVAWHDRVIAIPGRTFAGKSTLAAALVRTGAHYFSDEFLVLDEHGIVHPFPRPLHLRAADGSARAVSPHTIGAVGAAPLPLGLVVRATYRPGAPWRPRRLTPGQTALALLHDVVVARTRPAHAMARVARAMEHGVAGVRVTRGEADEAARRLLHLDACLFERGAIA